jgi:hypothetical protein
VDTGNPGFKADLETYERRMREEQEKKWAKVRGLQTVERRSSQR